MPTKSTGRKRFDIRYIRDLHWCVDGTERNTQPESELAAKNYSCGIHPKQDIKTWVQKDTYERIIRIKTGQQDFHGGLTGFFRPRAYAINPEQECCDPPLVQEVAGAGGALDTHDNAVLPYLGMRKSVTLFQSLPVRQHCPARLRTEIHCAYQVATSKLSTRLIRREPHNANRPLEQKIRHCRVVRAR